MDSKITISMVVYKKYDEALETVRSIEKHTALSLKKTVYIIDNSCMDDADSSRMEFQQEVTRYSDVRYINTKKNLGFGKGHNYTINELDSEYFAIVNPDILITDGAFESIISFMDNQSIGMAIPKIVDLEGNLQDAYRRTLTVFDVLLRMFTKNAFQKRRNHHSMKDEDYAHPFKVPFGQGSFLVIRTNLWKSLNGFDNRFFMYLEDADLCRRVNEKSSLIYCPNATVVHKWEKESHRNKVLFKIHVQSMIKYFNKWGWRFF